MITLNRADLDFLLRQVTVNYLVPDPTNPGQYIESSYFNYSALANAVDPSGLREVSGANNNIVGGYWDPNAANPVTGELGAWIPGPNSTWGQADQPFLNLSPGQAASSAAENAYNEPGAAVTDPDPRIISNLVATMFTTGPNANSAVSETATNGGMGAQFEGLTFESLGVPEDTGFVANAGVLGGGRFNQWFVSFGQFFDHGLDFVLRDPDPTAKITVPLSANDPLYSLGADGVLGTADDVTSITVTRADVANPDDAGIDGTFGTTDDIGYSAGADGVQGTADDVYAHAEYINNTGLLIDQSQTYGSHQSVNALIREYDANGRPTGRVVASSVDNNGDGFTDGLATWADIKSNALLIGVELDTSSNIFTNVDVHDAPMLRVDTVGKLMFTPDGTVWTTDSVWDMNTPQLASDPFVRNPDGTVARTNQNLLIDFNPGQLLDDHIITGDGRANENIGLTAVHHVFHEEHNAEVANIQQAIMDEYDAILADTGPNGGPAAAMAFIAPWQINGEWDGEKLYQAARLITESEYNHIAIDQFVGTLYAALPEFVSYSSDINMGVSLEFSQAVYRLGHSMLTETFNVDVPDSVGTGTHKLTLLEAFINPELYQQLGPAALAQGLTTTLGNEIDEFVTPALQQMLLGQPLDLATINIARGRDVGIPTWNEFREQVYNQLIQNTNNTNGSALAPYTNWADVGANLKSQGTLLNLIAAYGHDTDETFGLEAARATGDVALMRAAADDLLSAYADPEDVNYGAALAFMQGTPTYSDGEWTFVGADQGFWDIDLWVGGLAERPLFDGPLGTTFSYVILDFAQRMQDGDRFYYLFRTPMGTNLGSEIVENQFGNLVMEHTGLDHLNGEIFIWASETFALTEGPDYFNAANVTILDVDGSEMVAADGHLIIAGLGGDDYLKGGLGDDTIYGDGGNDQIYGSQGNDHLFGGDGDDYIFDDENDDFITGGAGNDVIFAGPGALDTVFGDEGDDEIHGGDGIDELLGGPGDDIIYGDGDTDVLLGGEGNDYLDGGDSVDEMWGQEGNDWLRGGVGDDHLVGGDGNDLLEGGVGPTANDGDRLVGQGAIDFAPAGTATDDLGFDVASYENVNFAITANLHTSNENGTGALIDTYVGIDGLVGTRFDDTLIGAGPDTISTNGFDNYLIGGAGDDVLTGLGGDDFIFGDSAIVDNNLYWTGDDRHTSGDQTDLIVNWRGTGEDRPVFSDGLGHILGDNGADGTADVAVFSGELSDYTIIQEGPTTVRIIDTRGIDSTTVGDLVKDVELFRFSDGGGGTVELTFAEIASYPPTDIQWNEVDQGGGVPGNGVEIANLSVTDPDSTSWTFTDTITNVAVSPISGIVTALGPLAPGQVNTGLITATDGQGGEYSETFNVRTGNGSANILVGNEYTDIIYALAGADTLSGLGGDDVLYGQGGADTLMGGAGNDAVYGGAGNDDIIWNVGDGVDVVYGGTQGNGANAADTFFINGDSTAEIFNIEAQLDGSILVERNGETVATLNEIEEIVLNGGGGGDMYTISGSFDFTALNLNTIEIHGGDGDDTVDISGLTSDHRIVFHTNGGNDHVIGDLRPQDVVDTSGGGTINATPAGDADDGTIDTSDTGTTDTGTDAGTQLGLTIEVGDGATNKADMIAGSNGNDFISAGGGADIIDAGDGDDEIVGGAGNDRMTGGEGDDTFVFEAGFRVDRITDFTDGEDLIDLIAFDVVFEDLTITQRCDDTIITSCSTDGFGKIILEHFDATNLGEDDFFLS